MPIFDNLPPAEFGGHKFPVSEISVRGAMRDHVHEYPHSPGGAPELLGRRLYEFSFKCPFMAGTKAYPKLWPELLGNLRIIFEAGVTYDLTVPTIGIIPAYCTEWSEQADPKRSRSGVWVDMKFREDTGNLFLVEKLIGTSPNVVGSAAGSLNAELDATKARLEALALELPSGLADFQASVSVFDAINGMVASVESYKNDTQNALNQLNADLAGLAGLCQRADEKLGLLNDPENHALLAALKTLWASANKLRDSVKLSARKIVPYRVPTVMSVSDVSRILYGGTADSVAIMTMNNNIDDAFAIPGGTILRVFDPAA